MNWRNHLVQFGIDLARFAASPSTSLWRELWCVSYRRMRYIERVGGRYFTIYERQRMFNNLDEPDVVAINVRNGDFLRSAGLDEAKAEFKRVHGDAPMYLRPIYVIYK